MVAAMIVLVVAAAMLPVAATMMIVATGTSTSTSTGTVLYDSNSCYHRATMIVVCDSYDNTYG